MEVSTCSECSRPFNLGINKPIELCCQTLCYMCVYNKSLNNEPVCPNGHDNPSMSNLKINYRILDGLHSSKNSGSSNIKIFKKSTASNEEKCGVCGSNQNKIQKLPKSNQEVCSNCESIFQGYKFDTEAIMCSKDHRMIEISEGVTFTKCSLCKVNEGNVGHCFKCNLHLCFKCADGIKILIPNLKYLKCSCQGELIWRNYFKCKCCNVCRNDTGNFGTVYCKKCQKVYCVKCTFDFCSALCCCKCKVNFDNYNPPLTFGCSHAYCQDCAEHSINRIRMEFLCEIDQQFSNVSDKTNINQYLLFLSNFSCEGDHKFKEIVTIEGACNICKIFSKEPKWTCNRCYHLTCYKCKEWVDNSEIIQVYSIKCINDHFFRKTSKMLLPAQKKKKNSCNSCLKEVLQSAAFCLGCKIMLCYNCLSLLQKLLSNTNTLKCSCTDKLIWDPIKRCKKCSSCKNDFDQFGSFVCKSCSISYCIHCAYLDQSLRCNICHNFIGGFLKIAIAECGHSYCLTCTDSNLIEENSVCPIDNRLLKFFKTSSLFYNQNPQNFVEFPISFCLNHQFSTAVTLQIPCAICSKSGNTLYCCSSCNFLACEPCKKWNESTDIVALPEFKCLKGHYMRNTKNAQAFYKRKEKFLCDGCFERADGSSIHCHSCKVDFCGKCKESIEALIQFFSVISCGCNGSIRWIPSVKCSQCAVCNKEYHKSGSFVCLKCAKKWCINCALTLRKGKCEMCDKAFLKKGLLYPITLDCKNLICMPCAKKLNIHEKLVCPIDGLVINKEKSLTIFKEEFYECSEHKFLFIGDSKLMCGRCRVNDINSYWCKNCYEFLCTSCKEWASMSMVIKASNITCYSGHHFRVCVDVVSTFNCSCCGEERHNECKAECYKCSVFVCARCWHLLEVILSKIIVLTCHCYGKIIWAPYRKGFNCSQCCNKFEKFGCFVCIGCGNCACTSCIAGYDQISNLTMSLNMN